MRSEPRAWLRPELIASWGENAGVLLCLLAPFVVTSAFAATHGHQANYIQLFLSNRTLLLNGAVEAALLGLGLFYFQWRGWTKADLEIKPGFLSSFEGVALVPVTVVMNASMVLFLFVVLFVVQSRYNHFLDFIMAASPPPQHLHAGQISWAVLIPAMILNAFLEEIICTAYMFRQFAAKAGPGIGLLLTVLLRMSCHTYQGPVHALGIGTIFLIYGLWYWRFRNIWTLIVAHATLDIVMMSIVKIVFN